MTKNIPSAIAVLADALKSAASAKADVHKQHIDATAAGTIATTNETEKALAAMNSAEKVGRTTLNAKLGLIDVETGVSASDTAVDAATVKSLDAVLAALEADQKALELARATVDASLKAARDAALEARAKLAPKAPEQPKKS